MAIALLLHLLATVIWVGGMFLAYVCVRPLAASLLEPPQRLRLWRGLFQRFFPWVWGCVLILPITGHWLIALMGGFKQIGLHVHVMLASGYLMVLVFLYLYCVPFQQLKRAVAAEDWPAGGSAMNRIRLLIATNLTLGLLTVANASAGRLIYG